MFRHLRHLFWAIAVLGILAASTDSAKAQLKFRGNNNNTAPPPVVFPPAPPIPMLNNGSLQTTANPNGALPNQVPFIYIAALPQDCRLNNNGVFVWEPRLDSMCFQLQQNQQNQNIGQNLGQIQGLNLGNNLGQIQGVNLGVNLGLNLGGLVQGFGAMRNPYTNYGYGSYYSASFDAARSGMGSNFGGVVSRMQAPLSGYQPAPALSGINYGSGYGGPQFNYFQNLTQPDAATGFANLGNFGGDSGPFSSFKTVKLDAKDDKEKADKEKQDAVRKDEDIDKRR